MGLSVRLTGGKAEVLEHPPECESPPWAGSRGLPGVVAELRKPFPFLWSAQAITKRKSTRLSFPLLLNHRTALYSPPAFSARFFSGGATMSSDPMGSHKIFYLALAFAFFFSSAAPALGQSTPVVGSENTATADPPVPVPNERPCVVTLFSELEFADFTPKIFSYTPSCQGPWEKVVFSADYHVTEGVQYDRTSEVYLGHVNLFFGTTPEPSSTLGPSWHVERDVTDYSSLFSSEQSGEADLGNLVNSTYTGVIFGTAELKFYPAGRHDAGGSGRDDSWSRPADAVYPLPDAPGGAVALNTSADQLSRSFSLPTNVERAYLDVIAQSQSNDEFWYTCVPNDQTGPLQSCGNTGFRETEVTIDGTPAGVAPVYPWIYTGGIDPFLWFPIPGVQTLNFIPYRVDLTPFAGLLSNGSPHTIALSVFNSDSYFSVTATLLLYLDHDSTEITGGIISNNLASAPSPDVTEALQTDASGNITGNVSVTSNRTYRIAGYVNTSHGAIETDVTHNISFSNSQNFDITAQTFTQDIALTSGVESHTSTFGGGYRSEFSESFSFPLTLDILEVFNSDGSLSIQTSSDQHYHLSAFSPFYASSTDNEVTSTDTLFLNSSFEITGNTGQQSSQSYTSFDSRGTHYSCSLAAANNTLASVSKGCSVRDRADDH
jgi:hypothetical protein